MSKVLIILTDGFEEIEAITPIDILRRAGCEVLVAGLGKKVVMGSHGVLVTTDILLKDVKELPDALVLPGGPGSEDLGRSTVVREWVLRMNEAKKIVSAICAAPATVLAPTGILEGKKATCFPGYETRLGAGSAVFSAQRVVTDGDLITSRGPGTAMEFSLELVRKLMGPAKASEISGNILAGA
jgi:4-methyl-5(b-hydroxyethyl)-thiazole monophosphate biosynthesis